MPTLWRKPDQFAKGVTTWREFYPLRRASRGHVGRVEGVPRTLKEICLAEGADWLLVEQKLEPSPLEMVASLLDPVGDRPATGGRCAALAPSASEATVSVGPRASESVD